MVSDKQLRKSIEREKIKLKGQVNLEKSKSNRDLLKRELFNLKHRKLLKFTRKAGMIGSEAIKLGGKGIVKGFGLINKAGNNVEAHQAREMALQRKYPSKKAKQSKNRVMVTKQQSDMDWLMRV